MTKRERFAKALWETFRYELRKDDKIRFVCGYADENIADVVITRADGCKATVDAYDIQLGCFQ